MSTALPASSYPVMEFIDRIREMGLDEDDEASQYIKQLGLLTLLSGLDKT